MDHFGIGFEISRMIEGCIAKVRGKESRVTVRDGDRVVFIDQGKADDFAKTCLGRGLVVTCVAVHPSRIWDAIASGSLQQCGGRTIFSREWIEAYYLGLMTKAIRDVAYFHDRLSLPPQPREAKACSLTAMQRAAALRSTRGDTAGAQKIIRLTEHFACMPP